MAGPSMLDALAAVVASASEPVSLSRDGRLRLVNRAFAALFGGPDPDALIGVSIAELVSPDSWRILREVPEVPIAQLVGRRRDGTVFDLEVRRTAVEIAGEPHVLAFLSDVSARLATEHVLREREEFYRAMFEVNTSIKLLIDPTTGAIVDANPAAVDFYGWPLDQLRTMSISQINTLTPAEVTAEMADAQVRRRTSFLFRHRTADGRVRDVEVYSGPCRIRDRDLLLSIVHDVTDRMAFEEALRRANRLDAIGRLAAGIAHDFNNVLTVVVASAQIAERHLAAGRDPLSSLGDIRHAAQRGADLTRQLLAFARQQHLTPVLIEPGPTLERIAALLRRVLGDAIAVTTDIAPALPPIRFDPGQLEMVLLNLALNARDAMPHGGELLVGAAVVEGGSPTLAITVSDTGLGMDAHTQAHALEPFFTTKAAGQGTGLGLSTVYGVIEQSGGRLTIESAPGRGTRVQIVLPIAAVEPERPLDAPALAEVPIVRRMLLVDDRPDVRAALRRILRDAGIAVTAVEDGAAALAALDAVRGEFDVIVSDVAMPGMSGVELAAEASSRYPHLPIVLVSGDAAAEGALHKAGVGAFVAKPFTLEQLFAGIAVAMRAH
jgi:PAS domain S-box-containing protein